MSLILVFVIALYPRQYSATYDFPKDFLWDGTISLTKLHDIESYFIGSTIKVTYPERNWYGERGEFLLEIDVGNNNNPNQNKHAQNYFKSFTLNFITKIDNDRLSYEPTGAIYYPIIDQGGIKIIWEIFFNQIGESIGKIWIQINVLDSETNEQSQATLYAIPTVITTISILGLQIWIIKIALWTAIIFQMILFFKKKVF